VVVQAAKAKAAKLKTFRMLAQAFMDAPENQDIAERSKECREGLGDLLAPNGDGNIDPLAEAAENGHQAVNRESPKIGIADAGEIRRCNVRDALGFPNGKAEVVKGTHDFRSEQCL
jgi:hypothetical protein